MLLLGIVGLFSYSKLSQSEDPPFTFKVMVVQTYWPGATAEEVSLQITDKIEKQLMSTGSYDKIMAYSRPGESMIMFMARDSLKSSQVPDVWYQVRKRLEISKGNCQVVCKDLSLMMSLVIPTVIFMCSLAMTLTMRL